MEPRRYDIVIGPNDPSVVCDVLVRHTGLSKTRIKQAMVKGAVWRRHSRTGFRRLRRATSQTRTGDQIRFYYDEAILSAKPPSAHCVRDHDHYGIWFKPAGMLVQGTHYGDHCALLRQVEQHFKMRHPIYPIHRIDREVSGLVVVGYSHKAAALFSELFKKGHIEKRYMAWVNGELSAAGNKGRMDMPLDGKKALTTFSISRYEPTTHETLVDISIQTGRYHQIRRHFDMSGHPVMGDPKYGKNNKNKTGLQLIAYRLAFECPFDHKKLMISIDPEKYFFGLKP